MYLLHLLRRFVLDFIKALMHRACFAPAYISVQSREIMKAFKHWNICLGGKVSLSFGHNYSYISSWVLLLSSLWKVEEYHQNQDTLLRKNPDWKTHGYTRKMPLVLAEKILKKIAAARPSCRAEKTVLRNLRGQIIWSWFIPISRSVSIASARQGSFGESVINGRLWYFFTVMLYFNDLRVIPTPT